jgi:type II secretory pathway pseudopilin PulG
MRHRGSRSAQLQITNYKSQISQRGYILITLMLFIALLAIAAMAVMPKMAFQIKRDREEEMIHRAVAYSRAIKRYYKKFGRYPSRIEELENTNNVRFLRKRYQDPITGKDFKILRLSDVMQNLTGQPGGSLFNPQGGSAFNSNATPGAATTQVANAGDQSAQGDDSGIAPSNPPASPPNPRLPQSSSPNPAGGLGGSTLGQTLGGGPILGVASASKQKTIREFNDKKHYNEWLFIYDPTNDRGGLLNGPAQPNLNGSNPAPGLQPGANPGQVIPNGGLPQGSSPPSQGPPNPPQMPPDQ